MVVAAVAFLWLGFVGAISFMEAWLKFRAPGVDLSTGLGIGRLVFKALNRVEWTCALLILAMFAICGRYTDGITYFALVLAILAVQTFLWLPQLDKRAAGIASGQGNVPASNAHYFYIAAEVAKAVLLVLLGLNALNNIIL